MTDQTKPNCVILTSREWNEWLASDPELSTFASLKLVTKKEELTYENISILNPKYIFVPHWSSLIPGEIYKNFKTIIFHMTDLPFGRGGSPLQNLISSGMQETKISAIECTEIFDAGSVYLKANLSLHGAAEEIFIRASNVVKVMIRTILAEQIVPQPQTGQVTIFKRRKPEESNIAPAAVDTLEALYDFIRMLDAPGYPKAYFDMGPFKVEFSEVFVKTKGLKGTFEIKHKDTP